MMHSGRHSVNVSRVALLEKLRENLEIHKKDYIEACEGYKIKLLQDLASAGALIKATDPLKLHTVRAVVFSAPVNHEKEYQEIIDMMEHSVDETINLDSSDFKSYFKNEWTWSGAVNSTNSLYKSFAAASAADLN
jgi:hypothetical protein